MLGDNLGLNSFLDFNKSFSANTSCRLCKITKIESHQMNVENTELMRTADNYEVDVHLNNPQQTGVVNNSLLNEIPSFHVVENYYVDAMHDVFEGVCHYSLAQIINYFTKMKYFNLETLNSRKKNVDYGPKEIDSISGKNTIVSHKQASFQNVC